MTASLDARGAAPATPIRRERGARHQAGTLLHLDGPLQEALLALNLRGEYTRCFGDDRFTSEIRAVRLMAELECPGCPVYEACQSHGAYERDFVWGGVDRTPCDNRKRDRS